MTEREKGDAALQFCEKWKGKGDEKQHCQKFWIDLLSNVYGIKNSTDYIVPEKKVKTDTQNYIDIYIPSANILIEQKSINIDLDKPYKQSNGQMLTAYEQAKKYDNDLPLSEKARYIITCNFRQFYIYDMNKSHPNPIIVELAKLPDELYRLEILVGSKNMAERKEEELSIKAGELVGKLYNALEPVHIKVLQFL